jgi:hypothetical protein
MIRGRWAPVIDGKIPKSQNETTTMNRIPIFIGWNLLLCCVFILTLSRKGIGDENANQKQFSNVPGMEQEEIRELVSRIAAGHLGKKSGQIDPPDRFPPKAPGTWTSRKF